MRGHEWTCDAHGIAGRRLSRHRRDHRPVRGAKTVVLNGMATVTNLPLRGLERPHARTRPAHSLTRPDPPIGSGHRPAGGGVGARSSSLMGLRGPAAVMTADCGGTVDTVLRRSEQGASVAGLVRHGVRPCRTSGQWPMPAGSSCGTASDVVRDPGAHGGGHAQQGQQEEGVVEGDDVGQPADDGARRACRRSRVRRRGDVRAHCRRVGVPGRAEQLRTVPDRPRPNSAQPANAVHIHGPRATSVIPTAAVIAP